MTDLALEDTQRLYERLARLEMILAADQTGRTAELKRGIARIRAELERRGAQLID
jgi:hypothetical protein